MHQRRFPRPWRFEPIPGGYRVIDANGRALAPVYGQPPDAVAFSDKRLTDDEAEKLARLIARLPELIELEQERNKAKSRRLSPRPSRPITLGHLTKNGTPLRSNARPTGRCVTSILNHRRSDCPSVCRCRKWQTILCAASVVPRMTNSSGRYGHSQMPE
jgi:hypothetical protein